MFILSIIAAREDAKHGEAILAVETWLKRRDVELYTRKRTPIIATADIHISKADLPELMASLQEERTSWLDVFGCDVNICSKRLSEWWKESNSEKKCLFIFDLDSTLVQMETIDEMARLAGKYDQVAVMISC